MEKVTKDVCEVDYPPVVYGQTLEEIEATIQEVVERIFRDEDGMIRSGVYGKTMKPLRLEEVKDRPHGIGCFSENHHIPNELKPIYNNYEDACQASGKYIRAMLQKYAVTGNSNSLDLARKTFKAIELLWNNVAEQNTYPGGRGWMPKPFGGIQNVAEMTECSPDQYTDVTLGLNRFYREAADAAERKVIEEMVISFADWWFEHYYTTSYEGATCWWKLRPDLMHVMTFFMYLNAWADAISPNDRYKQAFELWLKLFNQSRDSRHLWAGTNAMGLSIECVEHLIQLKPRYKEQWLELVHACAECLLTHISAKDSILGIKGHFQYKSIGANYLTVAFRILGDRKYKNLAEEFVSAYDKRSDFYQITRGVPVEGLSPIIAGDDYRNMFTSGGHICWLTAYWMLEKE